MKKVCAILVLLLCVYPTMLFAYESQPLYFCTAADDTYYSCLRNLIGSIHAAHSTEVFTIAVFDIGLTSEQRTDIAMLEGVTVYDVELTHPDLLTRFSARGGGRNVPGWYAWKPVIMKQALDMFPYVLYIDAGISVCNNLSPVFEQMLKIGHIFFGSTRSIAWMSTDHVITAFNLRSKKRRYMLNVKGMLAGIQGVTRSCYQQYVMPMYQLSYDLRNFAEDGSNSHARHDQPLFSICAHLAHLALVPNQEAGIFDSSTNTYHKYNEFFDINCRFNGLEQKMIPFLRYKNRG